MEIRDKGSFIYLSISVCLPIIYLPVILICMGEMAQSASPLLHRCKDLSLDSKSPCKKSSMQVHGCSPSGGKIGCRVWGILGAHCPTKTWSSSGLMRDSILCKRWKAPKEWHLRLSSGLHVHTHACTWRATHTCTWPATHTSMHMASHTHACTHK